MNEYRKIPITPDVYRAIRLGQAMPRLDLLDNDPKLADAFLEGVDTLMKNELRWRVCVDALNTEEGKRAVKTI